MFSDNIYQRRALLGTLRSLCLNLTFKAYWSEDESSANSELEELGDNIEGVLAVTSSFRGRNRTLCDIFQTGAFGRAYFSDY